MNINIYKKVLFSLVIASLVVISSSPIYALETITVSSLKEQGETYTAKSKGIFRFSIQGGAYEPSPPSSQPDHPELWGWKTAVLIYKNKSIQWATGPGLYHNPVDWDYLVGVQTLSPTYEEAEEIGKGKFIDIPLNKGDSLVLVINDAQNYFWDNSGEVIVEITQPRTYGLFVGIDYLSLGTPFYGEKTVKMVKGNWQKLARTQFDDYCGIYDFAGIDLDLLKIMIDLFLPKTAPGDNFVFYFSGHGTLHPEYQTECLLIGKRNGADVFLSKDLLTYFLHNLDQKGVNIWVILEACNSGGFWFDALETLNHVGLIAAGFPFAGYDSNGIGIFSKNLANLLPLAEITFDTDFSGDIDFDEFASQARLPGMLVASHFGKQVFTLALGDPVTFSSEMWNPFSAKSSGFSGKISGSTKKPSYLPFQLLLLD
jgi:hypothetical protein